MVAVLKQLVPNLLLIHLYEFRPMLEEVSILVLEFFLPEYHLQEWQ